MASISIVNLSEIKENGWRIDGEYWSGDVMRNEIKISNFKNGYKSLGVFVEKITGGETPLGANYSNSGVLFLRVQNIMQNYFDLSDKIYITNEQSQKIKRSLLKENDVLLTITGVSYGKSTVVPKELEGSNINQHSVKIVTNGLNPYFLSTFLNSRCGKLQSDKHIVGITRPALDYKAIKSFKIPILTHAFQTKIEQTVRTAHALLENSKQTYKQAEEMLLAEVFGTWKPATHKNWHVKMLSEVQSAQRMDAEYFHPKYEDLIEKIKGYKHGFCELGEVVEKYNCGFAFKSNDYQSNGIPLIRINNIKKDKLDLENAAYLPTSVLSECNNSIAKSGDILLSMSGTIGNCAVIPNNIGTCFVNQRVMSFSVKDFIPEVLSLLLNGIVGEMQFEQIGVGGLQVNLSASDIKQLILPLLPITLQTEIAQLVKQSFEDRTQSKALLELAKTAVEKAIEEGEDAGFTEIN